MGTLRNESDQQNVQIAANVLLKRDEATIMSTVMDESALLTIGYTLTSSLLMHLFSGS